MHFCSKPYAVIGCNNFRSIWIFLFVNVDRYRSLQLPIGHLACASTLLTDLKKEMILNFFCFNSTVFIIHQNFFLGTPILYLYLKLVFTSYFYISLQQPRECLSFDCIAPSSSDTALGYYRNYRFIRLGTKKIMSGYISANIVNNIFSIMQHLRGHDSLCK